MKSLQLKSKQLAFVNHFVTCRNGAEAARLAGYSVKTARQIATENLSKPHIQATVAEKQNELKRKLDIDQNRVVTEMLNAVEVAKEKLDAGSMIRAWVEISKMLGLHASEKLMMTIDVAGSDPSSALIAKYEAMSDEELIAIVKGVPLLTSTL